MTEAVVISDKFFSKNNYSLQKSINNKIKSKGFTAFEFNNISIESLSIDLYRNISHLKKLKDSNKDIKAYVLLGIGFCLEQKTLDLESINKYVHKHLILCTFLKDLGFDIVVCLPHPSWVNSNFDEIDFFKMKLRKLEKKLFKNIELSNFKYKRFNIGKMNSRYITSQIISNTSQTIINDVLLYKNMVS